MSRIEARFADLKRYGEGALVTFLVAGHPTPEGSLAALEASAQAGADVIELGIPFSDPLADGPVIQAASQVALRNGVLPQDVFAQAAAFRARHTTPLVVMTCYNPIYRFGVEDFARECARSGVDGVIATDLPPEEATAWTAAARREGVDTIFLLAPSSTPARVEMVAGVATGFVYCVSRMGVTGARTSLPADLRELVRTIRAHTRRPIAVGFGVSRPEHVAEICQFADGAVVGSALVSVMEQAREEELPRRVARFVEELKRATRDGRACDASDGR